MVMASDRQNAEIVRLLRSELAEVDEAYESALAQVRGFEEWKRAIETLLRRYDPGAARPSFDPAVQSTRDQLVQLAQANGGLLITKKAVPALVDAGVFASKMESNRAVFDALAKAKVFDKVKPGQYRYIGLDSREEPPPYDPREERA